MHQLSKQTVNPPTWVVYLSYALVSSLILGLSGCKVNYQASGAKVQHLEVNKSTLANHRLDSRLKPFRQRLDSSMNVVLATSEKELSKNAGENLLGNFCTDLLLNYANQHLSANADFALLTNGGLRVPIPKGAVTVGTIYELMPFDNQVVVLTVNGRVINQLAEMQSRMKVVNLSGAITTVKSAGVTVTTSKGSPIDPNKQYRIVTIDYLADGGDQMQCLSTPIGRVSLNFALRDLFIAGVKAIGKAGKPCDAQLDGRLKFEAQ